MFGTAAKRQWYVAAGIVLLSTLPASAAFDSGSDGSDGLFNPHSNITVHLAHAATGPWDMPAPTPGKGVYDPDLWVVVFKYTAIDIPAGVTVQFSNHPSGAPVVWLATGEVTIAGTVSVDGQDGGAQTAPPSYSVPGPGGFGGGVRSGGGGHCAGFGPGAGVAGGTGQSYGGEYGQGNHAYGNVRITPLIGGSGGNGYSMGGGAGGGAILIASSDQIVIDTAGTITADGGNSNDGSFLSGAGSGGAIRLVTNKVGGAGILRALGGDGQSTPGDGGVGRIRVDAVDVFLADPGDPPWTTDFADYPVFPPEYVPVLRIVSINELPVTDDPGGGIMTTDLNIDADSAVTLGLEAHNIPAGTTVMVTVTAGHDPEPMTFTSDVLVDAGGGLLTATAEVTLPPGRAEIQLKANWTP